MDNVSMKQIDTLISAAKAGAVREVADLIDQGVPVDATNGSHRTALDLAVWADQVAVVRLLLSAGADPEQKIGEYGEDYPLRFAAPRGMLDLAAVLLEGGARPEGHPEGRRGTPVVLAASQGQTAIVEMLLDRGVNIEGFDAVGARPLVSAAFEGHLDTVRFLLDRGAQPRPEAVEAAERRVDHYASDPARLAEFTQTIAILRNALAGIPEADGTPSHTGTSATDTSNPLDP
jgi:ankyrin repeat protein